MVSNLGSKRFFNIQDQSHSTTTIKSIEKELEPKNIEEPVIILKNRTITAYTASPEETDSTPCITASGFYICDEHRIKVVANNELEFGTRVRIGGQIYFVQDRMARKNDGKFDILMKTKDEAFEWGKKTLHVEVLK